MENPSRVALLKQFNWKKVALLVQNLDIYVLVRDVNLQKFLWHKWMEGEGDTSPSLVEGVIWKYF